MRRAAGLALVLVLVLAAPAAAGTARSPRPSFARTIVAAPVKGVATIQARGSKKSVPLRAAAALRPGATIDATKGTVRLRAAMAARGKVGEALVSGGRFTLLQEQAAKGLVELRMVGGGISCSEPHGAAGAQRLLRVRTRGGFSTRGCFARIRPTIAPAKHAVAAQAGSGGPGTAGPVSTWAVWEYPTGWRITSNGDGWLEVTDLVTNTTQTVHQEFLYKYVYEKRPPLPTGTPAGDPVPGTSPTPANALLDPIGDLLPCGFATCADIDLRAASLDVTAGTATFRVEGYEPFPALPTLNFQIWTSGPPGSALTFAEGDYFVQLCVDVSSGCTPGTTNIANVANYPASVRSVGSWSVSGAVVKVTWPLSGIGAPSAFWWAAGSDTCGWRDKIPDTGGVHYPVIANGARLHRGPIAHMAC